MYEEFYGCEEKPFSISPDPNFLYLSAKHKRAITLLEYGIVNHVGFSVVTGDIGCGKTTLVRKLLQRIEKNITVGLVSNTQVASFEELLKWILFAFDLDYRNKDKVELYEIFTDFLIKEYAQGRRTVLIVDEAQHLGADSLEQLRMLSNINADKDQVLQLTLVGQPELWKLLRRRELEQFTQRIGVDYHLKPLDECETECYIKFRLGKACNSPYVFSDDACREVFKWTNGVPRLINLLCDMALVYGFADQVLKIEASMVEEVARERVSGLIPLKNKKRKGTPGRETKEFSTELKVDERKIDGDTAVERWYQKY